MSHVFLTGFMGSGKSTVGRLVAERLGRPFVDLDARIEQRTGMRISQLFQSAGEEGFREAEHEALAAAVQGPASVIACGGGVVLRDENRRLLKRLGTVVYLSVTAEEALARIGDAADRPLLAGDARGIAPRILEARLSLYRATADVTVDTTGRTVEHVADEVVRQLSGTAVRVVQVPVDPPYEALVGRGALELLPQVLSRVAASGTVAVVTDETVGALHGGAIERLVREAGFRTVVERVAPGERSKSWRTAGELVERFAAAGLDRGSAVVAFGGGVIGDLAGFAGSVYMRGVPVVQVPTTLLAQVDSSIGGKTGVDLEHGKNLAGTFWQPCAVIADTGLLHTLPDAEWANGWAEVVKTALLAGGLFWEMAADSTERLAARDDGAVLDAVESCVRFKAGVVGDDPRESSGLRECLNLGHTLGHAIERELGYGTVSHGVAVAEGLRFAARLSAALVGLDQAVVERIDEVLRELGVPRAPLERLSADRLLAAMRADKKALKGEIRFVLLRAPGEWVVERVDEDALRARLRAFLEEGGATA